MSDSVKYLLPEDRIPRAWYNIAADLPQPLPAVLHPGTGQPIGPADLSPIFPIALILQEVAGEREIEISQPVRDVYKLWRPSPLYRAARFERVVARGGERKCEAVQQGHADIGEQEIEAAPLATEQIERFRAIGRIHHLVPGLGERAHHQAS